MANISKLCLLIPALTFGQFAISSTANAGGLWAQDFGDPSMGRANAGATAGVDDASTTLHNPAYMSSIKKEQLMVAGGIVFSETDFNLESVDESTYRGQQACKDGCIEGGSAGGFLGGASMFYVKPINDKWTWGMSFSAVSGGATDYDDDWVGRFDMTEMNLAIVALSPSVSYQVNDWLSLGLATEFIYGQVSLDLALPEIPAGIIDALPDGYDESKLSLEDNDTLVSYSLSAAIKLSDKTRVGIKYQPEFTMEFDDISVEEPAALELNNALTADLVYAQFVRVGLTHQYSEDLELHMTIGWDDWSAFESVPISIAGIDLEVNESWEDTYHIAMGVSYYADEHWLLSTGFSYDSNPSKNDTRYAQLAVDEQKRIAFGAQYDYGMPFTAGVQFLVLDAGKNEINRDGWYYTGDFDTFRAYMLMANASWEF